MDKPTSHDLKYPTLAAIDSVLAKIGVDPAKRYGEFDQDHEYTTCRLEELHRYVDVYKSKGATNPEKRVLGCYFFECLNEYVQKERESHPLQEEIFSLLHEDEWIHKTELEYWSNTSEQDPDNWWPITTYVLSWRRTTR